MKARPKMKTFKDGEDLWSSTATAASAGGIKAFYKATLEYMMKTAESAKKGGL